MNNFFGWLLKKNLRYLTAALLLIGWQIFAVRVFPARCPTARNILPAPTDVVLMGYELLGRGELGMHIMASIRRVAAGFLIALSCGTLLGVLMGVNRELRKRLQLLIVMLRPIPPFAWIPLGLLWFGVGDAEAVMVIMLSGVFHVALHTLHGIDGIDPALVRVASSLGVNRFQRITKIVLPGMMPEFFFGLRTALAFCWVAVVGAEMVGSVSGLGYLILDSRNRGLPQLAVLGMVLIGFIGTVFDSFLVGVKKLILPWDTR